MAYHSWQNKAPSKEFDEGHAATFGEKADPFCSGCGRLPHFCECADTREPDDCQIACESTQHCGHPKKFHFKGGSCCVGGCKCRGYFVGPAT